MTLLTATLVTDGSSDRVLLPILRWLVGSLTPEPVELRWADLRGVPKRPVSLAERVRCAVDLYPCRLLFVHRDAERRPPEERFREVEAANRTGTPHVCVVPVRMQEAWLLLDEGALREAAGRPLRLPPARSWEAVADPKAVLHEALSRASGARGRRARRFDPTVAAHRLADLIEDWSPLRKLSAFRRLEADTRVALTELGVSVGRAAG